MIQTVNWLLTRKCNLQCDYCRIARSYNHPKEYPPLSYYFKNEMTLEFIIEGLRRLKLHNRDCFHLLYGGEPFVRPDLKEMVKYCNAEKINYTIITNNSDDIQDRIQELLKQTEVIGFTSSVDPVIFDKNAEGDALKKSLAGLERLSQYGGRIKDLVAEITVDRNTLKHLYPLVKKLTARGINSDITFIDIAKSEYYDFSNITDPSLLVSQEEALPVLRKLADDDEVEIHMKSSLLPKIYESLPANVDCRIEDSVHNLTIDSDGSVRLCLRIRGILTPTRDILYYLEPDGRINDEVLREHFKVDRDKLCRLCQWTCPIMSQLIDSNQGDANQLIHAEKRELKI